NYGLLRSKIPRTTQIGNQKVTTERKESPKICFYCEREEHVKKDCEETKTSIESRRLLREAKSQLEKEKTQKLEATKINFSFNNPYRNDMEEEKTQKPENTENNFSLDNLYKNDIEEVIQNKEEVIVQ
ncbi:33385_t:CDS:1, partial [Racocetra persica]